MVAQLWKPKWCLRNNGQAKMDLGLEGKIALITGGNKGIGAASADRLAAEGAKLFLTARNKADLEKTARDIEDRHDVEVAFLDADLTIDGASERTVASALDRFNRIDILVNSAGASQGGVFWEIPDKVWQDSFDLKVMATVRMIRTVIPHMQKQKYGRVVTIVGNTGRQPSPRMLPGAAANAALLAITKGLADEVAPDGVVVNAVNPGPTRTERWNTLMKNLANSSNRSVDDVESDFMKEIPMNRLASPDDIARIVTFLASDAAANITGTSITADGGWTKAMS
jgi:3-oxoacyl-[acyl-carrier protein] reductase